MNKSMSEEAFQNEVIPSEIEQKDEVKPEVKADEVSDADEKPKPKGWKAWVDKFSLWIAFVVFVIMRAMDRIFLKRVNDYMVNYNFVLMSLFWPISMGILTFFVMIGYVSFRRWQTKDKRFGWRWFMPGSTAATAAGTAVAMWKLSLLSFFDQLNASIQAPAQAYLSQPIQSLLSNMALIWTVGLAFWWLGTRFRQVHYIGCLLIIISVLVGIADKLENSDCSEAGLAAGDCFNSYKGATGSYVLLATGAAILWWTIYILGTVPLAVGNVYKQWLLKAGDMDIWYATFWAQEWQVVWGLLFFPLGWIPYPDQKVYSPADTGSLIADSWSCFVGNVPNPNDPLDQACAADGGPAIMWFAVYMFFNLSFNLLFYYLTKRMSAVWATIATTLCLDLTNIFSQFDFLMGSGAELMSFSMWLGTIIASIALWVYNLEKETDKKGRDVWVTNRAEDTPTASEASEHGDETESQVADADDIEKASSEIPAETPVTGTPDASDVGELDLEAGTVTDSKPRPM
jgi:hypothetical protein